jgi:hypothetical protein
LTFKSSIMPKVESNLSSRAWQPHPYQRRGMKRLLSNACTALWLDPGMGKTSTVLGAFKVLKKQGMSRKLVVIAPLRPCYLVWPKELKEWVDFHELTMTVLHGDNKDVNIYADTDIYVINPEGLPWLMGRAEGTRKSRLEIILDDDAGAVLVVDEITKFKHTNTQRFKTLKPALELFARRWTLTGSPSPNGYLDLFGQIFVCDMGHSLGRYISHYRNEYFAPSGYGGYTWLLQEGAETRIQRKLKPLVFSLDVNDYLEVPKVLDNIVRVELPPKALKIYKELHNEMLTVLESGKVVTAMSVAAASIKCMQVANGGLYHNVSTENLIQKHEPRTHEQIHDAKTEALLDIIEELGGKPVFIAYNFQHDLERLRKALGKNLAVLGGKGSNPGGIKYDLMLESGWNSGQITTMAGHPASIGHGLNLQGCQPEDLIIYGDQWDFELYDQLVRRFSRQGNKQRHFRGHHIIATGTVDEALYASKGYKGDLQATLRNAMKARIYKPKNKS